MAIVTFPLVVSSTSVLSLLVITLSLLFATIVDVADVDGPSRNGSAKTLGQRVRGATADGGVDRLPVNLPYLRRAARRRVSQARLTKHLAVALETDPHTHLHAD